MSQGTLQFQEVTTLMFDWVIDNFLETLTRLDRFYGPEFCVKKQRFCLEVFYANANDIFIGLKQLGSEDISTSYITLSMVFKDGEETVIKCHAKYVGQLYEDFLKSRFFPDGQLRVRCRIETELHEDDKPTTLAQDLTNVDLPYSDFTVVSKLNGMTLTLFK